MYLLIALLMAFLQDSCGGPWFLEYKQILLPLEENIVLADDDVEIIYDKTMELYMMKFRLIGLTHEAPECAQEILLDSAERIGLEADWGMLMLFRKTDDTLTDRQTYTIYQWYQDSLEELNPEQ